MGVGGKFWDLLKPYARFEGLDFLRDKRVAVDLSYWIVQHETAIKKNSVPKPHLRLTFFRTINLFAKFGAFPVFVVDGTPSPLKSQARLARFYRFTIDSSTLPVAEEGILVERNQTFLKCVQECVELLELFGMPVLKAKGEAEALCAQLNSEGYVDACITADSDAFLFGAKCVVKCIRPNTKEPFECYCISDIEAGLGLKRKHLIAMSLLIGNDHDLNGVQGIGLDTALQFVQNFSEDEILNILHKIGNGDIPQYWGDIKSTEDAVSHSDESMPMNRKEKEQKKHETWWIKVCSKIALETNFPNDEIVTMYLCENNGTFTATDGPSISWGSPMTEMLVDFLVYHQPWQPSYIRQKMLPMLSTIYLREMATNPVQTLLCGQYEFDSIRRVKIRYGHQSYVVKWKKAASAISGVKYTAPVDSDLHLEEFMEVDEPNDLLDESSNPQIHVDGDCWFLLTDENMKLVHSAFPKKVDHFLQENERRELKRKRTSSLRSEESNGKLESPKSKGVQLSITEFYRSAKVQSQEKSGADLAKDSNCQVDRISKENRRVSSPNLSKSARRRLLFN
ncbi:Flap endonuclease GEN-like 1 [Citrus sinensis]|uniref:Flap endonuclease GEN-like 1 n=1 Tax=Citrus sinensis TaxID=2711 RepID=A0ACB8MQB0_CITSI|nr:Flap endonuclease GEN-like 1 [Citrus sinensis]